MKYRKSTLLQTTGLLCVVLSPVPALAQDANAETAAGGSQSTALAQGAATVGRGEAQGSPDSVDEIVVSGSRIQSYGYKAPTPTTVITSEEIEAAAPVTIADYVNQLPAVVSSTSPQTARGGLSGSLGGANLLNLRNLGASRTLVLLDGRRVPGSFLDGSVDLNTLPTALVKGVDVVTGGASAAWGSDAVAGVFNLRLDTKYEGIKAELQKGISDQGDAKSFSANLAIGLPFAGGRGHVVAAGDYASAGRAIFGDRDWHRRQYRVMRNPAFAPGNGEPERLLLPNTSLLMTDSGFVASGPLRGLQFGPDGQPTSTPFDFNHPVSGLYINGSTQTDDPGQGLELQPPLKRGSVFGRVSFELTDDLEIYGEGLYADSHSVNRGFTSYPLQPTVKIDNAYLPVSVRDAMIDAGVTTLPLNATMERFGRAVSDIHRSLNRYSAGFNAKLGRSWSLDGYVQRSIASIHNLILNNPFRPKVAESFDAVVGPAGEIICRSSLNDPNNGCVPWNPFGTSERNAAQIAWTSGTAEERTKIRQTVAAITLHGDMLELPAGPLALAAGGEYRRDSASNDPDPISVARGFLFGGYQPFDGRITVKEGFAEVAIPLLSDTALAKKLDLNFAARITDYSESGTVTTWKIGGVYEPTDDLTFRITRSRDIRAPNLKEIFLAGTGTTRVVRDPFTGNQPLTRTTTSGNRDLKPEVASTLTAGLVYQPEWANGLRGSIDFYDIKIKGAISLPSPEKILLDCFDGDSVACGLITRDAAGNLTEVFVKPLNERSEHARGVDTELTYRTSLSGLSDSWQGHLTIRGLMSYVDKLSIETSTGIISRAGEVGTNVGAAQGSPRIRGLFAITYGSDHIDLQIKNRIIGSSKIESDWGPLDINRNKMPTIVYTDIFAGYTFEFGNKSSQVYFAIDNLFDTDPPPAVSEDSSNLTGIGTNAYIYDLLGRTFRAGIRVKF